MGMEEALRPDPKVNHRLGPGAADTHCGLRPPPTKALVDTQPDLDWRWHERAWRRAALTRHAGRLGR